MSRLPDLEPAALSPEARAVYDDIALDHARVRGPWQIELRIPEVAHHYHGLYRQLCVNPKVGKRLFEMMVIVVARHFTAQFEWYAHERGALANGIAPAIVGAVRNRRIPTFEHADEQLVYELTRELLETNRRDKKTYERALAAFGEEHLVELIIGAGTYASIAMQLNAFDVTPPDDAVLLEGP
jgi:4-carboxymuconolactone decarboxylase